MLSHFRSFSGEIWLNCSLSSAMSFAFCSVLRRKAAPPVTRLRLTALPTRKCSLNASFNVTGMSAVWAVGIVASSTAAKRPARKWSLNLKMFIGCWSAPWLVARGSRREFDFNTCQRSAGFVQKAHGSLPTVLFVDDFENEDVGALLQGHLPPVRIEHQRTWFTEGVNVHAIKIDSSLIVAGHCHNDVWRLRFALDVGDHVTGSMVIYGPQDCVKIEVICRGGDVLPGQFFPAKFDFVACLRPNDRFVPDLFFEERLGAAFPVGESDRSEHDPMADVSLRVGS